MQRRPLALVVAVLCFGSGEAAFAQELPVPLPALDADVAAVVEAATEIAVAVELPTVDAPAVPVPTLSAAPVVETPTAMISATEAGSAAQYQPAAPQYQEPEEAPVAAAPDAGTTPAAETPSVDTTPTAPAEPVEAEEAASTLPQTWDWNWTWDCNGEPTLPSAPAGATAWSWNWNWNCNAATVPNEDPGQYQGSITQYQPGNTNVAIRIGSPGDDGPVTQTITTVTQVVTTVVTEVTQRVEQVIERPPALVDVPGLPTISLDQPFLVPGAIVPGLAAVLPFPPLIIAPPVGIADVLPIAGVVEELLGSTLGRPAARAASVRRRSTSTADILARPSFEWPAPRVSPARAAHESSKPANAPSPKHPRRAPLPQLPGGAGLGAGQSASAPALALAALAAALAAYLLVPPLGARRLRRARDRRRLGLLVAPLERPG